MGHLHQQRWARGPEHGALVHEARPPLAEGVVDDEPLLVREEVVALWDDLVRVGAARLGGLGIGKTPPRLEGRLRRHLVVEPVELHRPEALRVVLVLSLVLDLLRVEGDLREAARADTRAVGKRATHTPRASGEGEAQPLRVKAHHEETVATAAHHAHHAAAAAAELLSEFRGEIRRGAVLLLPHQAHCERMVGSLLVAARAGWLFVVRAAEVDGVVRTLGRGGCRRRCAYGRS